MSEERTLEIVPVQDSGVVLMPVMNIQAAKARLKEFQEFVREYLVPEEDYGIIPGTAKPTLLKSGADKLTELYGLADDYTIESRTENYGAEPSLFDYTLKCTLTTRRDGRLVGTGFGSCNSWEGKYRWRESKRKCPLCHKEAIIKGKTEYGGGWLCFKKKDGCGAKFPDGDKAIESQVSGKEINDDIATQKNTILKMAKKRAKIDAVIAVTRSSGIFTQDMEDIIDHDTTNGAGTSEAAQRVAKQKVAEFEAKKTNGSGIPRAVIPKDGAETEALLKASIAQNEEKKAKLNLPPIPDPEPPKPRIDAKGADIDDVVGTILAVKDLATKDKKRPYKALKIKDSFERELDLQAFDNFALSDGLLFQYLTASAVGKEACFTIVTKHHNDKIYNNIINITRLGNHRWEEGVGILEQAGR